MEKHNIHRVSVDTKHFEKTVIKGVAYAEISKFMTKADKEALKPYVDDSGKVYCWGSLVGKKDVNIGKFKKMRRDDENLFYRGFKYVGHATTIHTTDNEAMARYLWGEKDGKTWRLMYFLTNVGKTELDREIINEALEYKPNAIVQGLSTVSDEKAARFLEKYGSVASFMESVKPQEKAA